MAGFVAHHKLIEIPFVSKIDLGDEQERLLYKNIIEKSGLENSYVNSWAYVWQIAAAGRAYKYYDGKHLLSLTPGWGKIIPDELVINSPQTVEASGVALNLAAEVAKRLGRRILIRKVYCPEAQLWLRSKAGMLPEKKMVLSHDIKSLPDDNFPERIAEIESLMKCSGKKFQWFRNCLNYFNRTVDCRKIEIRETFDPEICIPLLEKWAADLAARLTSRYSTSTVGNIKSWIKSPYPQLFQFFFKFRQDADLFSFVTMYDGQPVAVLRACRIGKESAALYANFSLTKPKMMPAYHMFLISRYLRGKGFKKINYGGSEISGLDFFKKKCGGFVEIYPETFVVSPD